MTLLSARSGWVVLASLLAALLLTLMPLPLWLDRFRPDWVTLALIYWCLALPTRVGVGTGWTMGLILDAAKGTLLGQHALALAVVAWLAVKTHQRVRTLPLPHQALIVCGYLLTGRLLVLWINGMIGYPPRNGWALTPVLGGMLLWPLVFVALRDLRRRFGVA
ncbi:MAG: rod shape-determining protein MreD [Candidatus Competibacteraceae bacterium]|nr:rod shape-determining protein MreD [Candidatus Competibacteraceae bacterium]